MTDFKVEFTGEDTFDVTFEDNSTFDITFEERGAQGAQGPQGPQGNQGNYYVKIFLRAASGAPDAPTDVTWTPGAGQGTLSGANADGWGLSPQAGVGEVYETEQFFDPSVDTNITEWPTPYLAGSEGPPGETATISIGTVDTVASNQPATVTNSGGNTHAIFDFEIPRGSTGLQGDAGPQGERGVIGPQGPQGAQGAIGLTGQQGAVGQQGAEGPVGPQGNQGETGQQGVVGAVGPQGAQGLQGLVGPQGMQGLTGQQGPQGAVGPQGAQGPQGLTGPQGQQGEQGDTYRPIRIYQNAAAEPSRPTPANGFDTSTGDPAGTGNWVVDPSAPVTGQFTWVADATVLLRAGDSTWSIVNNWVVSQLTGATGPQGAAGSGSGSTPPAEHFTLSLSPNEVEEDSSGATTVTGTLAVNSQYAYIGTGSTDGNAGSETVDVRDADNNQIAVTKANLTDTTFTFSLSETEKQTVQAITAHASIWATYNGANYERDVSATVHIYSPWYVVQATAAPTSLTGLTSQGRFNNPETFVINKAAADTNVYLVLPDRTDSYTIKSGIGFLDTVAEADIGDHEVLRLSDLDAAPISTTTIEIEES